MYKKEKKMFQSLHLLCYYLPPKIRLALKGSSNCEVSPNLVTLEGLDWKRVEASICKVLKLKKKEKKKTISRSGFTTDIEIALLLHISGIANNLFLCGVTYGVYACAG